jgi:hypothetical protein
MRVLLSIALLGLAAAPGAHALWGFGSQERKAEAEIAYGDHRALREPAIQHLRAKAIEDSRAQKGAGSLASALEGIMPKPVGVTGPGEEYPEPRPAQYGHPDEEGFAAGGLTHGTHRPRSTPAEVVSSFCLFSNPFIHYHFHIKMLIHMFWRTVPLYRRVSLSWHPK